MAFLPAKPPHLSCHPACLSSAALQTFLQRAANTLLSPLVFHIADYMAAASGVRLAAEFNFSHTDSPAETHRRSRMMLVNGAAGVSVPRSLPPNVKASGCMG
jgi:hypothetical protein